ncbi:MAG TPA: nicotinamide-nucleotide amidohydrolase family protein [Parasegetibacter sp.]
MEKDKLLERIKLGLTEADATISIAESVTSGRIQQLLSQAGEAMQFYQGGLTAYNLNQKVRLLRVDEQTAARCNCVSEETAVEMALGIAALFSSDYGLAITGYATPVPEMNIHQPFAYLAIVHHSTVLRVLKMESRSTEIDPSQEFYAIETLKNLASVLI